MKAQPKLQLVSKKIPVKSSYQFPICETCKAPIEDSTFRFLIVQDDKSNQEQLSFHFFFPCWDVNYVCSRLSEQKILHAGFDCDEGVLKNPQIVNNLQKNCDLWDV